MARALIVLVLLLVGCKEPLQPTPKHKLGDIVLFGINKERTQIVDLWCPAGYTECQYLIRRGDALVFQVRELELKSLR